MNNFPELKKYSNDDLILILHDESELWQDEAVKYAESLLTKRGVSQKEAKARYHILESQAEKAWLKELEVRKTESYNMFELLQISGFWYLNLCSDWSLAKEGYHKKSKQRLYALVIGVLAYLFFIASISTSDKEYQQQSIAQDKKMDSLLRSDSIKIAKVDWSGSYTFIDSSKTNSPKKTTLWELVVRKEKGKHKAKLILKTAKTHYKIHCVGVIKKNEGMVLEFLE